MSTHDENSKTAAITVNKVIRHSHNLVSFIGNRPQDLLFRAGECVSIGLPDKDGNPMQGKDGKGVKDIWRDFSIITPPEDEEFGILSIINPEAEGTERDRLTPHFENLKEGDKILVNYRLRQGHQRGSIIIDELTPGEHSKDRNLFLVCTGTGLAPFLSMLRDKHTWQEFQHVYLVRGASKVEDLAYHQYLSKDIYNDEYMQMLFEHYDLGELKDRFTYYPTVTQDRLDGRDPDPRITNQAESGELFKHLGLNQTQFNPATDRVLVCGSKGLNLDLYKIAQSHGLTKATMKKPGEFAWEGAFVEYNHEPDEPKLTVTAPAAAASPMASAAKAFPNRLP